MIGCYIDDLVWNNLIFQLQILSLIPSKGANFSTLMEGVRRCQLPVFLFSEVENLNRGSFVCRCNHVYQGHGNRSSNDYLEI